MEGLALGVALGRGKDVQKHLLQQLQMGLLIKGLQACIRCLSTQSLLDRACLREAHKSPSVHVKLRKTTLKVVLGGYACEGLVDSFQQSDYIASKIELFMRQKDEAVPHES